MPNAGAKDDELGDVYELLGVEEDAGDKEIQGAFRRGSLKCHPDRNPDDPEAPEKFDRLSRAKELLLDGTRRAEFDRKRKAKRDLDQRNSQEDEKRRKLREDLEGREGRSAAAASAAGEAAAAADARKRFAQMDFAARIKAKEAELAGKQAEVAAVAAKARSNAAEARVRVKWREPGTAAARIEAVEKALADLDVRTIVLEDGLEAIVQLGSREEALRAVLNCRERRQQLPFRVTVEKPKRPAGCEAPEAPAAREASKRAGAGRGAPPVPASGFDDWEAKMLDSLRGLAEAQKGTRGQQLAS